MRADPTENPLTETYFAWLHSLISPIIIDGVPRRYAQVCQVMFQVDFEVLVPHDDNRVAEGAELRNEFLRVGSGSELDRVDLLLPDASVLEVLIALAMRAEFMIDIPGKEMFYLFLQNLRLSAFTDEFCRNKTNVSGIERIVRRFSERKYTESGRGGLFPLRHPSRDQREVELWYQMGEYMTENEMY